MAAALKVGIAGFGVVGRRRKQCIDLLDDMELVAVCDRTEPPSGLLSQSTPHLQEYTELLDRDLDALFVCMSNDMAAEVTIAGLERGLHVFCEKPPARSMAELDLVIDAERRHPGAKLMYGFNHRYHESVEEALSIVRSGELGALINLRGVYGKSQLITFDQSDWRTRREIAGGGVLLDQGIHMVDLMRLFAGEFTEVHSFVSNSHWGYDVEDNAYALMRTDDGVVGMLASSATQWRHRFSLEVNLEGGSVILSGILSGSKSYGDETLTVTHANPARDSGVPREQTTKYIEDPSWLREVTAFRDAILRDSPIASGSSEDAIRTLGHVCQIYYQDPGWRERFAIPSPSTPSESSDGVFGRPEPVAET